MIFLFPLIFFLAYSAGYPNLDKLNYQFEVEKWLGAVANDLQEFNSLAARLTWDMSVRTTDKALVQAKLVATSRNRWKNAVCQSQVHVKSLTDQQRRKLYLFCRGAQFPDDLIIPYLTVVSHLSENFNAPVCLSESASEIFHFNNSLPKSGDCLYGEPDLERLMQNLNLEPNQLKFIWTEWHNSVGPRIKDLFYVLLNYENLAAKNNGYHDIGQVWKEELEIPDLELVVEELYKELKPFYELLHAVVRHKLYEKYGPEYIDLKGPIPVHLLGNMWGQDWSKLLHLFIPESKFIDFEKRLKSKGTGVRDLVHSAEDFYMSLGLPRMTSKFWKYSVFEQNDNTTICHGSAANLYSPGDYRMLMCGQADMYDFYVIHHEMGHIEYYMAYEDQSAFFQDGASTAIHESIGDSIMHGVMTPQHLNRLGLLSDDEVKDYSVELLILFQQALSKIPEIPFSLIIDKYRWAIFRGDIDYDHFNRVYWDLNLKYRGLVPPEPRGEEFFDAGGKFHIPDNTPYIRYFLSSIIQMDLFKSYCKLAIFGKVDVEEDIDIPLHRCDIYGFKKIGKKLLEMMKFGSSIDWSQALELITGHKSIDTKPLFEYYAPVYKWLLKYAKENKLHIGW